ncbi:MAG: hypothetical protein WD768_06975 [Phycisphaeraceae bacterium]
MTMQPFHKLFPDIGHDETRTLWLGEARDGMPAGDYAFVEWYCVDPDCDCRRVLWRVMSADLPGVVATITHAFESPAADAYVPEQTYLEPLERNHPFAPAVLRAVEELLLTDENYVARLRRHYQMVKVYFEPRSKPRSKPRP